MKMLDVVQPQCIETGLAAAGKDDVLRAVVAAAKRSDELAGVDDTILLDGLREREALGSTGFGGGIAIPHCRIAGISNFVVGVLTFPDGVHFEALDSENVQLVVFIIGPDETSDRHVRLLSAVSRALLIPGAVRELVAAQSAEALRESFVRHSTDDLETGDRKEKCLVHLFVQDDERIADLMRAFAAVGSTSFVVVEAENASAYLARLPLFAGFLTDTKRSYGKIIVAIADRKLRNEIVRQVEQIVGKLDDATGVLLTVQDIGFAAGSLET